MAAQYPKIQSSCPDRYEILKSFSRANRIVPTDGEYVLWQAIRNKQLGVKFRRQHSIYDYIVDFVCLDRMLIIEVDGEYHFTEEQKIEDILRQQKLEGFGYKIIRFTNAQILEDIDEVVKSIQINLETPISK